jgi:hypothetical protein
MSAQNAASKTEPRLGGPWLLTELDELAVDLRAVVAILRPAIPAERAVSLALCTILRRLDTLRAGISSDPLT